MKHKHTVRAKAIFIVEEKKYKIVHFGQDRYAISDLEGKVVDNANNYGYKTSRSAYLAMNYKFLGGKQKSDSRKKQLKYWLNSNPANKKIADEFQEQLEWNFKELSRDEISLDDIWKSLEDTHGIEIPTFVKKQIMK
jgi:hypothetical protein